MNPVSRRHAGGRLAQPARGRAGGARRRPPVGPGRRRGAAAAAAVGRSCRRSRCEPCCSPEAAAALKFGTSPDGTAIGPDDFATTETVSFAIDLPAAGNVAEFQADAELGKDRNAVVRVMISDRPEGSARDALQRVVLGDATSAGYKTFRAGMAEYVALAAAELARRSESRRQGSGAGAVRQHLQQPRARRVRAEGEVPAQRRVLHRQHGRRRRPRAAQPGVERSLRLVAVPRRLSRHARRSLQADAEEPPDSGFDAGGDRGAAGGGAAVPHVAARALRRRGQGAGQLAQPGHVDGRAGVRRAARGGGR